MTWWLRFLVTTSAAFVALAVWAQPRMADDWYLAWYLFDYGSLPNFVVEMYLRWGGRVVPFALAGLALSSELGTQIFKLLTIPCFFLLSVCAYYLAHGAIPRFDRNQEGGFLVATAVLWLGVPVANETIIQTTGAAAYLWPATLGLGMLCLLRRLRDQAHPGRTMPNNTAANFGMCLGMFVAGVVVGMCNEQLVAGMSVVILGWVWMLRREGRLPYLATHAWWATAGLILGALILVAAPGNYSRLGVQPGSSGILSTMIRFGMYLGGAYFGLGTGDAGRSLWLGMMVLALGGTLTLTGDRGREAGIWLAGSFATLMPMLPLVNYASPRTTFLAVTFLFIAVTSIFPPKPRTKTPQGIVHRLVPLVLCLLVLIDGFAGWAANRALAGEMAARMNIIRQQSAAGMKEAVLPYLATVPSRLTFILNPEHDLAFVESLAGRHGLAQARHDDSVNAPRPQTLNPLKALKNSF